MSDIRTTIDRLVPLAGELQRDSCRELRAWNDICSGQTSRHVDLVGAKLRVDWAHENIAKIKAALDEAVAIVEGERAA